MKCYELKNCCFNGTDPSVSKCQPHQLQIGCWEYDWVSYYNSMPECEEKYEWRDVMLNRCPGCQVYALHPEEMERILEGLRGNSLA